MGPASGAREAGIPADSTSIHMFAASYSSMHRVVNMAVGDG